MQPIKLYKYVIKDVPLKQVAFKRLLYIVSASCILHYHLISQYSALLVTYQKHSGQSLEIDLVWVEVKLA